MVGAQTRLFHAIVGLGLAAAGAACGSSGDDAVAGADAASDAASTPSSNADASPEASAADQGAAADAGSATDTSAGDAGDGWTGVPIR